MNLWYCFPITVTKVDLEGEGLVCVPISIRICKSSDAGMKLKTASVLPLMTIENIIISAVQSLRILKIS